MSLSHSLADKKQNLRKEKIAWRNSLSKQDASVRSGRIAASLRQLPEYEEAETVLFYVSAKPNEVDTHVLMGEALANRVRIFVPVTDFEHDELVISELNAMDELVPARFGLLEPGAEFVRVVDPDEADIIIVPGVAFDADCRRIGFGGGYYDRLLSDCRGISIALSYEGQMVERVPTGAHDVPVDIVVTENRIYRAPGATS